MKNHTPIVILAIAASLIGLELMVISQSFDAKGIVLYGDTTGWRAIFGYFGAIAKVCSLAVFIIFALMKARIADYWHQTKNLVSAQRFAALTILQLVLYIGFFWLSARIFKQPELAMQRSAMEYGAWFITGILVFGTSVFSVWPASFLAQFWQRERVGLFVGFTLATAVWWVAQWSSNLWGPLSEATFYLSAQLLSLISSQPVYADVPARILGTGEFFVNIAPTCSGYEGIGLITAFLAIYLYTHKNQFRFPRAYLLFPLGAACIWLLNVVRIVALIQIGQISPEVAVGGFHSQAGWLTFIFTSLALVWAAGRSSFFSTPTQSIMATPTTAANAARANNLAVATLQPFVTLMAVMLLTSVFVASFDWLYPLRVIAVVICLAFTWRTLKLNVATLPQFQTIGVAIAVAVMWYFLAGTTEEGDASIREELIAAPVELSALWLVFRFLGAAITVPIAEELAFRGYLLCKLSKLPVRLRGELPLAIVAICASSILFGALHGAWIAGTLAGAAYAWLRISTKTIEQPIWSHAITNALLFGYAAFSGQWSLI